MISGGEVMKKSGHGEGGNVKIAFPDDFFFADLFLCSENKCIFAATLTK